MKLQVMVSDAFVERLDRCARELGQSRSAFCAFLLATALADWELERELERERRELSKKSE